MNRVEHLTEKVESLTNKFVSESELAIEKNNKSAAKRARILTNDLTKLLKEYRKESIKAFK